MEIFKKGKRIENWGIVYAGLKRKWITASEVIRYCEEGKIVCNEERLVQLHLAIQESLFIFFKLIKSFIIEDGYPPIEWNEDSSIEDFSVIPQQYWNFWELEFLLRIVNTNETIGKKLHKVAAIHSEFNYPPTWHNFLYYMSPVNSTPIGEDGLYKNLLDYIESHLKTNTNT